MSRSRLFAITDFEHLDPDAFRAAYSGLRYFAGALETCPTTGKAHYQAVAYFDNQRTVSALGKKRKNNVEVVRGHPLDAIGYCAKGDRPKPAEGGYRVYLEDPCDGFFEEGERPSQGKRSDIEEAHKAIKEGAKVDDLLLEHPELMRMDRHLDRIEDIVLRKKRRTEMTKGIWLWGGTGVGKTHEAYELAGEDRYVHETDDKGWWDGYRGQESVIIDDFRGAITYNRLLTLVDKYDAHVPRRNRAPYPFTSKLVIITSSLPPDQVFKNLAANDSLDQLYRRFEVRELTGQSG